MHSPPTVEDDLKQAVPKGTLAISLQTHAFALLRASSLATLAQDRAHGVDLNIRPKLKDLAKVVRVNAKKITARIRNWAHDPSKRSTMLLMGPPGAGKTAWLANWMESLEQANARLELIAGVWDAASFPTSALVPFAAATLSQMFAKYGQQLSYEAAHIAEEGGSWRAFLSALPAEAPSLPLGAAAIFVVDGLHKQGSDASHAANITELAQILKLGLEVAPPWLRILVTCRRDDRLLEVSIEESLVESVWVSSTDYTHRVVPVPRRSKSAPIPHTPLNPLKWSSIMAPIWGPDPANSALAKTALPLLALIASSEPQGIPIGALMVSNIATDASEVTAILSSFSSILIRCRRIPTHGKFTHTEQVATPDLMAHDTLVRLTASKQWLAWISSIDGLDGAQAIIKARRALADVTLRGWTSAWTEQQPVVWRAWVLDLVVSSVIAASKDLPDGSQEKLDLLSRLHSSVIMCMEWALHLHALHGTGPLLAALKTASIDGYPAGAQEASILRTVWVRVVTGSRATPREMLSIPTHIQSLLTAFCSESSPAVRSLMDELEHATPFTIAAGPMIAHEPMLLIKDSASLEKRTYSSVVVHSGIDPSIKEALVFYTQESQVKSWSLLSGLHSRGSVAFEADEINCLEVVPPSSRRGNGLAAGPLLLAGSDSHHTGVWAIVNGGAGLTKLTTLEGHTRRVWSNCVIDDIWFVSASDDHDIRVYEFLPDPQDIETPTEAGGTWAPSRIFAGHTNTVMDVKPSTWNGAPAILSCSDDNDIRLWDLETATSVATLHGDSGVKRVAVLQDGRLVSGGRSNDVVVWSAGWNNHPAGHTSDVVESTLEGHTGTVRVVTALPSSPLQFASAGEDSDVRLWQLHRAGVSGGDCLAVYRGHSGNIWSLRELPDRTLLSSALDKTLFVWNTDASRKAQGAGSSSSQVVIKSKPNFMRGQLTKRHVSSIIWLEPYDIIVTGARSGFFQVWSRDGTLLGSKDTGLSCEILLANSRVDCRIYVAGTDEYELQVWEIGCAWDSWKKVRQIDDVAEYDLVEIPAKPNASPDDPILLACARGEEVKIVNVTTGQVFHTWDDHDDCVNSVLAFDHRHVLSASDDHSIRLYDVIANRCIGILHGHTGYVGGLAYLPHLRRVASVCRDGNVLSFDIGPILDAHVNPGPSYWAELYAPPEPMNITATNSMQDLAVSMNRTISPGSLRECLWLEGVGNNNLILTRETSGMGLIWDVTTDAPPVGFLSIESNKTRLRAVAFSARKQELALGWDSTWGVFRATGFGFDSKATILQPQHVDPTTLPEEIFAEDD